MNLHNICLHIHCKEQNSKDKELYQPQEEDEAVEKLKRKVFLFEDQKPEYLLELAHGYVKKGQKPK